MRNRGFDLIELVMVVAILLLGALVILPRFARALTSGLRVYYLVNVDADQNNAQTVLSGDDHPLVNNQPIKPGVRSLLPTDRLE